MNEPVRYRVSMPRPASHLFEVEASFPPLPGPLEVALPVWTPGSYLVREYSRHVQQFTAVDGSGAPVPFERLDKRRFLISAPGRPVTCRYKVYANELTVRTSHLDDTHGYFNGATLFFYAEALRGRPHHVNVDPPDGWQVFCALPREGLTLVARDYDELVDSPVEVGPHTPITFTAAGVPHQVVLWGEPQLDPKKLVDDLCAIIQTEADLFGGLPLERYTFFIYSADKGRGGLEHRASTALLFPRTGFSGKAGWEDFITLAAHEYFHLWNVKRIIPRRFVPFDYGQENYTQLLWFFEGGTSYYDSLVPRRAGLMSAGRYLTRLGEGFSALMATPGRKVLPLAEASTISWVKHYRPDENSANSAISYYLKGELVCALLDLTIRQATDSAKSLDDVMRLLWERFGKDGSGVPEDGVEAAASEVAGTSLEPFFARALRSTEELDLSVLSFVGLEARARARESTSDKGGAPPKQRSEKPGGYVGIVPRGAAVAAVLEGSPAMDAGLSFDDEIVALDGFKCDAQGLVARCEDRRPGERITVSLFRREKLLHVPLTLSARPLDAMWLARVERPTQAQKDAYQRWLGASFDEPEAKGP